MGRILSGDPGPGALDLDAAEVAVAEGKQRKLETILTEMGSVLIAFSGGVDSAFLACVAHRVLGDRALAVTGQSPSYPAHQRHMAERVAAENGIAHRFIETHEVESQAYRANGPDRCFHCKNELYTLLTRLAAEEGLRYVVDGSNADDLADFRPGRRAARLLGVRSPLEEAGLSKREIRHLSQRLSLPTAGEPASACLSSRIPYRIRITEEKLRAVEEGEAALRALGFRQFRVRHHDRLVRLEFAPEEMGAALAPEMIERLVRLFKRQGYTYVTVDLQGYRTGSANEALAPVLPVV